ncbi:hypothetical protein ACTFIU_007148 [Dictyostelium citrinum]
MASILNSPLTNNSGAGSSNTAINRNSIDTIDSSNNNTATPRQINNNISPTTTTATTTTTTTTTTNVNNNVNNNNNNINNNNNNNNNNFSIFQIIKQTINTNFNIFLIVSTISFAIFIIINLTPVFLLWVFALIAVSGTFFQIWYGLRYNSRIIEVNGYHFYPGNNPNNTNNNINNNGGGVGARLFFPNSQFSRLSHLINPPLNLQLTLIDRDFNSNDYDMLLALDNDIQNHGGAKKEQIDLLPTHFIDTEKDLEIFLKGGDSKTCSICLDDFAVNDAIKTLPCIHHYHSDCVEKWLKIKSVCPICKTSVFES